MKLILTRPENNNEDTINPTLMWPKFGFRNLFIAWLNYNDIWVGSEYKDFQLDYNYVYDFYDLSVFEIQGNIGDARTRHFNKIIDFFKKEGYKVESQLTWRWEDHLQIKGKRIWVYIKKDKK